MADISQRCTSVEKDLLTRLIAAARVSEAVAWTDAETAAAHAVAALWGDRGPAEQRLPVEVTTEVLFQLAAAADTAITARHASGSEWAPQVERDLAEVRRLIAPAGG